VEVTRRTLSESDGLHIGLFEAHPASEVCGDVDRQREHVVVLPFSGVFSRHDAPGRHVIGTPSHAVLIAADTPYRIGFPGGIGDRALTLGFDEAMAPDRLGRHGGGTPASHGLLPANAMMLRNLLWARLERDAPDRLEIEALGFDLLDLSLRSMHAENTSSRPAGRARRMRAISRVKEAIAVDPAAKWSIAKLGRIANLSPFHLCHVFRQGAGTSIYNYVLHERLARTLDPVLDGGDLTMIALDAGFASHSHFTARFRCFFGCTPAALRRMASTGHAAEFRKIMTARRINLPY
jgi:AraC-like DNA-binding protein